MRRERELKKRIYKVLGFHYSNSFAQTTGLMYDTKKGELNHIKIDYDRPLIKQMLS
jgi:hypothetical protein